MKYFLTNTTTSPIFIGSNIVTYQPGVVHNRRHFPVFNLIVVHKGRMVLVEDGIEYTINTGQFFIQEKYKLHYGVKPDTVPMTFSFVHFTLPDGYTVIESDQINAFYEVLEHGRFLEPTKYRFCFPKYGNCSKSLMHTAYELGLELKLNYSEIKSKYLFYKLFDELLENSKTTDTESISTRDIKTFINKYYLDENFSLEWLCDKFKFSPQYISKLLKKQTGMNFRDYTCHLKMEYAKNLLTTRYTSISNIAITLGYSDVAAFSHHFHKKTGDSPLAYQRKHINSDK